MSSELDKLRADATAAYNGVMGEYGRIRTWVTTHPGYAATIIVAETLVIGVSTVFRLLGH